jgi:TRAP-type mannitol/chloroaromatic compound transport system substrate-binding protein
MYKERRVMRKGRYTLGLGIVALVVLLGVLGCRTQAPAAPPAAPAPQQPAPAAPPAAPPPAPPQVFRLKMQTSWPATLTIHEQAVWLAQQLETLSGGRLKIEVLPAGAIVGAFDVADAVHRGVIDMAHTWPGYLAGKHPAAVVLSHGTMFGMDFIDYYGWVWEGGGWELLQELYRDVLKMNVVSFPILTAGPQALGWFPREIRTLDDLKGIKFRIPGLGADIMSRAGVSVVTLPGAEIIPALERRVIDGGEWIGCVEDMRLGFHNLLKIHYSPGVHEWVTVGDLVINGDVWNRLDRDLQELIKVSAQHLYFRWWVRFHKQNAEACKELIERHRVRIFRTPPAVFEGLMKILDGIVAENAAKDPFYAKVVESQRRYASIVVPYRLSYWQSYDLIGNHYWKENVYMK